MSFKELSTHARDIELRMSFIRNIVAPVYEPHRGKDKQETKKWNKLVIQE